MTSERMKLECPSRSKVEKVSPTSLINAIGGERFDFESHNIGSGSGKFPGYELDRITVKLIQLSILGHDTGRITGKLI